MIRSFGDAETERVWNGLVSRKLPTNLQNMMRRKLRMLDSSRTLKDLRIPPGNRLEKLRGNQAGKHSIRVNQQWRIIFRWASDGAHDVRIIDYHQ